VKSVENNKLRERPRFLQRSVKQDNTNTVEKPEEKRPLCRSRHRWEDNIRMERREIGCNM